MPQAPRILLDTNLLLLYTAGSFDPRLIGRSRLDLFTLDEFELVSDFIANHPRRVTTPHLLAELSNLLDKVVPTPNRYALRKFLQPFLTQFDEIWHPAAELCTTPAFQRLGLADAAIAHTALTDTEVLTIDLDLHLFLLSQSIPSTNLNHLRKP